jgi:hypothetical protein
VEPASEQEEPAPAAQAAPAEPQEPAGSVSDRADDEPAQNNDAADTPAEESTD